MSKITLTPNAAGTGTFTLASPNSNTNRTFVLPDATGDLLTTTSSLPSAYLTGALPAIDGSALTGLTPSSLATTVTMGTWTITDTGGVLTFSSGGSARFSITAAGLITAADNVAAYGTP